MSLSDSELREIFGEGGLCFDPVLLAGYARSDLFVTGVRPRCVAYAASSRQVETFMKRAYETGTPVIPASSGGKHRRGGLAPLREGTVILSLERMKKLIEVNAPYRMVTVEAGVTHGELQEQLAEKGLMLDMPLAPKAEKSVVASLLEGEPRLNPNIQFASYAPLSCAEVTWADGVRMFTGEAGGGAPDYKKMREERHITMTSSSGPGAFDYNRMLVGAQGTTGVVTWVAFRCATKPTEHRMFFLACDEPQSLISFLYDLEHVRFGDSLMLLNRAAFAALMGKDAAHTARIQAELPQWVCAVSFANRPPFPSKRAAAHEAGARRFAQKYGLALADRLGEVSAEAFRRKVFSPCERGHYWKDTRKGASADLDLMTTMDRSLSFVELFREAAQQKQADMEQIGVVIQPKNQGVNCRCEFVIPYDPADEADTQKARDLWEAASRMLSQAGAYYANPVGLQNALQYAKDPTSYGVQCRLKKIFDPKGIMNPGKLLDYGKEGQE